jgi:hypothetical protein
MKKNLINDIDPVDEIPSASLTDKKTLFLDLKKISINKKGIPYFYWPIDPLEIKQMFDALQQQLIAKIRKAISQEMPGADAAIILSWHFSHEALRWYYHDLFTTRASDDGYVITPIDNAMLPVVDILTELRTGISRTKWYRLPLELMHDWLIGFRHGMRRRTLFPVNYTKRVIATTDKLVAVTHAKQTKEKVIYRRLSKWYRAPQAKKNIYRSENDAIIATMMETLQQIWCKNHRDLPNQISEYLTDWLKQTFSWIDYYWQQLAHRPRKIPHRLWVNDANNIWGRILARYVRKQGGRVTRFDEQLACGYFANAYQHALADFEDCDTYVTISSKQAEALRNSYTQDRLIQIEQAQFISLARKKSFFKQPKKANLFVKQRRTRPTILYMPSIYSEADVVLLDFIVRLLQKLRTWNFNVILKPYFPMKKIEMPASINHLFGPILTYKSLEQIYDQVDIILFDNLASTLLMQLMHSNKPCIYLNFQATTLSDHAYQLLTRRCPVVTAWYDEQHRAQVDWFVLRDAVLKSKQLIDTDFSQHYFSELIS